MEKGFFEALLLMPEYRKINEYMTGSKVYNKNVSLITMLFFLGLQYARLHTHIYDLTQNLSSFWPGLPNSFLFAKCQINL